MTDEVFFEQLSLELRDRGRVALASVIETRGSGPSRVGRRFLVFEDGSFRGTLGGGPFEALVVADAAALFRSDPRETRLLKWYDFFDREITAGGPREPTNMICGGSARVSIELLAAAPSLLVFGGGHVGEALARLAPPLRYDVSVFDDREEYSRPDRFPPEVRAVRTGRDYGVPPGHLRRGRDLYVAVVTRCWETDLAAVRPWLLPDAPPTRYLGVIGSARKVREVVAKLSAEGVPPAKLATLRAPIGISIGAVTPEEIAVSILAEMTMVRRGATAAPGESVRVAARSADDPMIQSSD